MSDLMGKPFIGICMDYIVEIDPSGRDRSYLKQYPQYAQAVARAGGVPLALPILPDPEDLRPALEMLDGVVLVGSDDYPAQWYGQQPHPANEPCAPQRSEFDRRFVGMLYDQTTLPVLAICGGMQITAIHYGGGLVQDIPGLGLGLVHSDKTSKTGAFHPVEIIPDSVLARALGATTCVVNSLHHQAVAAVPEGWRAAAFAPDGVIEAMENHAHPFRIATQWHPERMSDDPALGLWRAFVEAARDANGRRPETATPRYARG